ncbi:hypothetical protein H074_15307 [Amycolatopsis decaplanina DSM 44594]|uniref:Uncharacterized protein n=1 Tax=Amycolatopsis decaplanina DSM 44594 TaxID=1284240 RepID=M2XHB4_9PSEU|nr:hypothetical protein H074_15307 [Amycolatopsis decaplanina DSM 44594]
MGAREAMSPLYAGESDIGHTAVRRNEDMDSLLLRNSFQTMAAESPSAGEHRVSPRMEKRGADAMLIGRRTAAQQHDSGQQRSPGPTRRASAGDGPARHTDPFEIGRTDHLRMVRGGEQGVGSPGSSSHWIIVRPGTDNSSSQTA